MDELSSNPLKEGMTGKSMVTLISWVRKLS